jgi:hypothetical protein
MTIEEFNPGDMQILMHTIERVCMSLKLSDSEAHIAMKSRIAELVVGCAEGGERAEIDRLCPRRSFERQRSMTDALLRDLREPPNRHAL